MPLGIGKYSHCKLSTSPIGDEENENDDVEADNAKSKSHTVSFLGEQTVPIFLAKDSSSIINKVYCDNYSTISALISWKKLYLNIEERGITVIQPASRKSIAKTVFHYKLHDMILITADIKHEKVFAVVLKNTPSFASVYVYLCSSPEQVKALIDESTNLYQTSSQLKDIKVNSFPDSLEFQHCQTTLNSNETECLSSRFSNFTSKNPDSNDIQEAIDGNKPFHVQYEKPSLRKELKTNGGYAELRNDSLDDEFSQLALKRNKYQPEHMQDQSVESALLMQDNSEVTTGHKQMFSSYNRL